MIKYIPHPVVTGFTAGIAVIISSSRVKDFLGLAIDKVPADFLPKWPAYLGALPIASRATTGVVARALAIIFVLHTYRPPLICFLIHVVARQEERFVGNGLGEWC